MKRLIVVCFLVVAGIALTRDLFISRKIDVCFDVEIEKPITFQVFYCLKPKNSFVEVYSVKQTVTPQTNQAMQKVVIPIPIKRMRRFRLDFGSQPGDVTISGLRLKGLKELNLSDFEKFMFHHIDKKNFSHNTLTISSTHKNPHMIYQSDFKAHGKYQFDWKMLVILVSFFTFSFHRLVRYLATFKKQEQHSRIDIVFLAIFFGVVFLPALRINTADKSEKENRMLAKYVPLWKDNKINNAYGANFEAWFNDRFFGRGKVISGYNKFKELFYEGNKKVLVGKDNWLFYKGDNSIENYCNSRIYMEDELKSIASYLIDIHNWCEANNKKFAFIIAPDKHRVYGEFYPDYFVKRCPDANNATQQLIYYLKKNTPVRVIYPLDVLLKAKKDVLYWKHDTHWNDLGAYIGYCEVMKALEISPLVIKEWKDEFKPTGDLANMYPQLQNEDDTSYKVPVFKNRSTALPKEDKQSLDVFFSNPHCDKRLILFRDSFSEAMIPYFANGFGKVSAYWRANITYDDLVYIKENGDYVVLEVVERRFPSLLNLTFPKE